MKNKIKRYTFADDYHLHVQIANKYYVFFIDKGDVENCFGEVKKQAYTPKDLIEKNDLEVEAFILWFFDSFIEHITECDYEDTVFLELDKQKAERAKQPKALLKKEGNKTRVILPTTYQSTGHGFIQMPSPEYIKALVDRLEQAEQRIQTLEAHLKEQRDIALTTAQIQEMYGISPKTINQARTHGRIKGHKINGKEWGYPQKEVDRYIENSKGYFRNVS